MSEHKNTGNQNAKKDQAATAMAKARITPHKKAAWVKAANDCDMKLSAWMQHHLDKASTAMGYDPTVERWD